MVKKGIVISETERSILIQQKQSCKLVPTPLHWFFVCLHIALSIMKRTFSLTEGVLHKRRSAANRASSPIFSVCVNDGRTKS